MMKNIKVKGAAIIAATLMFQQANAYDLLTGEKKTACEVVLCLLAKNGRPDECVEPLKQYFEIKVKNSLGFDPRKTLDARKNFLKLCPKGDDSGIDEIAAENMSDVTETPAPVAAPPSNYSEECKKEMGTQDEQSEAYQRCIASKNRM